MLVTGLGKMSEHPLMISATLLLSCWLKGHHWGWVTHWVLALSGHGALLQVFQRPRFHLARPLSVSCLTLGKSFASNDFRVILKKKEDFPLMIFQKSVPIHMHLSPQQGWPCSVILWQIATW